MEANTVFSAAGLPSQAGGASSTAEFQFAASVATDVGAAGTRLVCRLPGSDKLNQKSFWVRAWGRVAGATTNFTVRLDSGISATIGSNTTIEASSARAVGGVAGNWLIEARCVLDGASDVLAGFGRSMVKNLFDAEGALDAAPTVDPASEGLGFTVTGQFSASDATNLAICDGFEIVVA